MPTRSMTDVEQLAEKVRAPFVFLSTGEAKDAHDALDSLLARLSAAVQDAKNGWKAFADAVKVVDEQKALVFAAEARAEAAEEALRDAREPLSRLKLRHSAACPFMHEGSCSCGVEAIEHLAALAGREPHRAALYAEPLTERERRAEARVEAAEQALAWYEGHKREGGSYDGDLFGDLNAIRADRQQRRVARAALAGREETEQWK